MEPVSSLVEHRVVQLERALLKLESDLEPRVRALEIAVARVIAWATGGAFAGGLAWQLAQWAINRATGV